MTKTFEARCGKGNQEPAPGRPGSQIARSSGGPYRRQSPGPARERKVVFRFKTRSWLAGSCWMRSAVGGGLRAASNSSGRRITQEPGTQTSQADWAERGQRAARRDGQRGQGPDACCQEQRTLVLSSVRPGDHRSRTWRRDALRGGRQGFSQGRGGTIKHIAAGLLWVVVGVPGTGLW